MNPTFEAHPSIQRLTHEPTMASPTSFGLGGGTNHSLRDVGLAEPGQEVSRPIATQGIETDRRSSFELPVPPKPHIGARNVGLELLPYPNSTESDMRVSDNVRIPPKPYIVAQAWNPNVENANSSIQRGTWKSENSLYSPPDPSNAQTVRSNPHSEVRPCKLIELQCARTSG